HQRSTFYLVRFRASSRFRDTRSFAPGHSSDLLDVTESGPQTMAVADVWAFGTLLIAAFGLGTALLSALSTPSEGRTEFAALAASAGLGAMGVLLGLLGLFGSLHAARFLIPLGAATTLVWIAKRSPGPTWPVLSRPSPGMALLIMMVAAALLGSIAP